MSKYIKQKQLLMSLSDWQFGSQDDERLWETIEKVINSIESLPTIDIVRCEECKHNPKKTQNYMYGKCPFCCEDDWYSSTPSDDFYCSYGERIDNE